MSKPTAADAGRACMNCGANKTPVWRTGPSGPKTMCNRCGIKWMRSREDIGEPAIAESAPAIVEVSSPLIKRKRERIGSFDASMSKGEVSTDNPSSSPEIHANKLSPRGIKRDKPKKKNSDDEDDLTINMNMEIKLKSPKINRKMKIERSSSNSKIPFGSSESLNFNPNMALHADDAHLLGIDDDSNIQDIHSEIRCSSPNEISISTYTTQIKHTQQVNGTSDVPSGFIRIAVPEARNLSLSSKFASSKELFCLSALAQIPENCNDPSNFFNSASDAFSAQGFDFRKCQSIDPRIVNSMGNLLPRTTQYLDLSFQPNVNVNTLRALPSNLCYLNLSRCKQLVDNDILYLPPQLHTLHISHCTQLTDESIKHLPNSLQVLNISNCYNITDEGIKSLPMTLIHLNVSMCYKITDEGLESLPNTVTKLNLESCRITDEGIKSLPSSIRDLNLESCDRITNDCLEHLPLEIDRLNIGHTKISSFKSLNSTGLRHLDLAQCDVTDDDILDLPQTMEWLNLFRCSKITNSALKHLPQNLAYINLRLTSVQESDLEELRAKQPTLKVFN